MNRSRAKGAINLKFFFLRECKCKINWILESFLSGLKLCKCASDFYSVNVAVALMLIYLQASCLTSVLPV